MFTYLAALQKRMEERQFYGDDRLYVKAARYSCSYSSRICTVGVRSVVW